MALGQNTGTWTDRARCIMDQPISACIEPASTCIHYLAGMAFSVPRDFWIIFCQVKRVRRDILKLDLQPCTSAKLLQPEMLPGWEYSKHTHPWAGRLLPWHHGFKRWDTEIKDSRSVSVSAENSLYQPVWLLLAKRDRERGKITDSCWFVLNQNSLKRQKKKKKEEKKKIYESLEDKISKGTYTTETITDREHPLQKGMFDDLGNLPMYNLWIPYGCFLLCNALYSVC